MQLRIVAQQRSEPHAEINPTAIDFPIISSESESIQTNDGTHVSMEDHLLYDTKRIYSSNIFNVVQTIQNVKHNSLLDDRIDSTEGLNLFSVVITTIQNKLEDSISEIENSISDIVDIDWENNSFEKPSNLTISNTKNIMKCIIEKAFHNNHDWIKPSIYVEEDGYVCMGWYNKNLTLYFNIKNNIMNYRKLSPAENGYGRKSESGLINISNCFSIWKWIIDEEI